MNEYVSFTPGAAKKLVQLHKDFYSQGLPYEVQLPQTRCASNNGPFLAIAQADIAPNTSGNIKLAAGATKGSETAYTDAYAAYFRAQGSTADSIASGDTVEAIFVSGGWEIRPFVCLPRTTRVVITQASISANTSGNCKFATGSKGSESASGSSVSMYWRTTGSKPIPTSTVCYATWVDDGAGHSGWELDPVGCL